MNTLVTAKVQLLTVLHGAASSLLTITALLTCLVTSGRAEEHDVIRPDLIMFNSSISGFMKKHCVACHGADEPAGDVRLDAIDGDIVRGTSVSLWKDVLHRIETGEMPPEDEPQPTEAERDSLAKWIRGELRKHLTAQLGVPGRVVVRRLSRTEYRNTMRDLLGLHYDIGRELPPDTTYHGFDHVASVQELSRSQLETYLRLARFAIDKAIATGQRPMSFSYRAEPELNKEGLEWRVNSHGIPENLKGAQEYAASYRVGRGEKKMEADQWSKTYRFAIRAGHGRGAILNDDISETGVWLKAPRKAYYSKGADWGRIGLRLPHIPRDGGLYRLRIKAGAERKEGLGTPLLSVWVFKKRVGDFEITASADQPEWYEFVFAEKDLENVQIHSDDNRFSKTPVTDIVVNNGYENPGKKLGREWEVSKEVELPSVFIDAIEFETNYTAEWPPEHHRRILFDSPHSGQPEPYAIEVLTRFMSRAFRRPVREEELAGKLELFRQTYAENQDFITAIKEPLVATLVSPQFLFIAEDQQVDVARRRKLKDYELASRLAYFLWSTMPDDELISLAAKGSLTRPEVLQKQIERMLQDRRAAEFHQGFMSQWLGLKKLDDLMIEDSRWIVRTGLRTSMRAEPAHFFAEMLRGNHSLLNFIESDFVMLNERMAFHYGIPGVYGNQFRKVVLKDEHTRGGLLTQAASMTISTDGMITSPIYRGKWVLEKILDMPPPPAPANVPVLDDAPKERLSLRDQFAKHRENASCAACHKKIDPLGWPFERYSILGEYRETGWGPNWLAFNDPKRRHKKDSPKPDLHGTLPDGTRVDKIAGLKQVILDNHKDDVLRSVTKNMLIYALGRPLDISDDAVIEEVMQQVTTEDYSTRELIRAVVFSKPFLEK